MSFNMEGTLNQFHLLGISFKNTPIDIREKFYVPDNKIVKLFNNAKQQGIVSAVYVATCNRTELYAYGDKPELIEDLFLAHTLGTKESLTKYCYRLQSKEAISHLFRTAAGLNSQVIGDFQVAGQLKTAFRTSEKFGYLSSFMKRLFEQVFQSTKQIKNSTSLCKGAASIAHAAVQYIKENQPNLAQTRLLLYGLGSIGKVACINLAKQMQSSNLVVINRTEERAKQVAKKLNIRFKKLHDLNQEIAQAEVIIIATGAPKFTIEPHHFNGIPSPKLILDLSVPRNVHSDVASLKGIVLRSIDDLSRINDETLKERRKNIPKAEAIIEENIKEFYQWVELRNFSPVFQALREKLLKLKEEELAYHKNKISQTEYEKADIISTNLMNKISRLTIKHIRQKAKHYSTAINTLEEVFKE